MNTEYKFPATIQELLADALTAFKAMQGNPRYKLNMVVWHYFESESNVCHVCAAGAWMAHFLIQDPTKTIRPSKGGVDPQLIRYGHVLNDIRRFMWLTPKRDQWPEAVVEAASNFPRYCCVIAEDVIEYFTKLHSVLDKMEPIPVPYIAFGESPN